ncbi:hypothetical protein ES332_D12G223000v1 [Gossypium tomentosum]|uniref:Uncharacterized protein n=1 Tax=Gossypium tomentosum TaxID=34277 RepID=A0A5D2IC25_GOSTO|nr:hypothetical protein ES332_D12G223000v1 [Gossypium tomentosum]
MVEKVRKLKRQDFADAFIAEVNLLLGATLQLDSATYDKRPLKILSTQTLRKWMLHG